MKRSPRPSRTSVNLSASVHHQLSMYALAAGAAGVGMLALAQPVEAKIIYTPADIPILNNTTVQLDLNQDGYIDLQIGFEYSGRNLNLWASAYQKNGIMGYQSHKKGRWLASALRACDQIGPKGRFRHGRDVMWSFFETVSGSSKGSAGQWKNAKNRYLGVRFRIYGKIHYGWVRLSTPAFRPGVVTGYAYETIPGKSIIAGKTHGKPNDPGEEDFSPGASLSTPIPDTPQPASLGMLALGAKGVPLWRRKESVGATQ
ncbi:MAG TPA: hypothetical protein VN948_11915 [Terriglobales bacterium]|nr:hypothetical protein [Terriglobales bacterium]